MAFIALFIILIIFINLSNSKASKFLRGRNLQDGWDD